MTHKPIVYRYFGAIRIESSRCVTWTPGYYREIPLVGSACWIGPSLSRVAAAACARTEGRRALFAHYPLVPKGRP